MLYIIAILSFIIAIGILFILAHRCPKCGSSNISNPKVGDNMKCEDCDWGHDRDIK